MSAQHFKKVIILELDDQGNPESRILEILKL